MPKKTRIGFTEAITVYGNKKHKRVVARIDTGAATGSIDALLAAELKLGPIVGNKFIKSAHGSKVRPVVNAELRLAGKRIKGQLTIADRRHLKYRLLIGRNMLKQGYLIDPSK